MAEPLAPPLLGISAWSGTGKTSLLVRLLPVLRARGVKVGVVKHAHHPFEIDQPGKDSFRVRQAGAVQVLLASRWRRALMIDDELDHEPTTAELVPLLDHSGLDLVLVEGFKSNPVPKIILWRSEVGRPLEIKPDDGVIAIATDGLLETAFGLPVLDLNRPERIADFIIDWAQL
jgi:molybdopterin-guanine dinucleotide biosynthesis protein MobB